MLSDDDYEEFRRSIRDTGLSPGDFEISTTAAWDKSQKLHLDLTVVSVRYLPTGATGTYMAGFGYYWLRNLEKHIKEGFYGTRPTTAA
ncbi:MAG: hypothetical protein EHM51_02705 [Geobacter sp.]|nr:MAG: hypothetical protein EHM51_02705 [Geobacter sp.]